MFKSLETQSLKGSAFTFMKLKKITNLTNPLFIISTWRVVPELLV